MRRRGPGGAPPRNGLAAAWMRERRRRAEAREKPARPLAKAAFGGTVLTAVGAMTLWLGGFSDDLYARANRSVESVLVEAGFTLAHVEVRGAREAGAAEVAERLMLEPGELIFNIDPAAAKARVEELPWVHDAAVLRLLPNRVVVLVDERRPLARWRSADGVVVLDETGAAIPGADPSEYGSLPLVEGEDAPRAAQGLVGALSAYPELARRAVGFSRVGGRRWDMTTLTGLVVRLPEGGESDALRALATLHERDQVLDLPLSVLDMRGNDLVLRPLMVSGGGFERGA